MYGKCFTRLFILRVGELRADTFFSKDKQKPDQVVSSPGTLAVSQGPSPPWAALEASPGLSSAPGNRPGATDGFSHPAQGHKYVKVAQNLLDKPLKAVWDAI